MTFPSFAGFGSEQTRSVDICGSQYGNHLLLGDDELETLDEPEGGYL